MAEVEEEQTLLPIYCRNEHKDQLPMNKKDVVIQVKNNLEKRLTELVPLDKFGASGKTIKPSIYKIPKFMKDIQPNAYKPQLVSFGPYHHGDKDLITMEQEKLKVFRHLVKGDAATYESILSQVSNILEDLYAAYDHLEEYWRENAVKFVEMMIIDAYFMLVFFSEDKSYKSLVTFKSDIKRDILLLENQLPFQLLELMYEILPPKDQNKPLASLINDLLLFVVEDDLTIMGREHILEMYRASLLLPALTERLSQNGNGESLIQSQIIPRATLLYEAQIRFRKSENKSLVNVSFEKGVLKLPHLIVDDNTETMLLNVMAFEKLHAGSGVIGSQVTSFIVLMDNLIDIDKDVELLSKHNIIANALGSDEDAAKLFSVLGKGVAMDLDSNMAKVLREVNTHCEKPWNKWSAHYKHTYFQSSWAAISFLATNFGFAILIVQVVYQIVDFHTKKK